MPTIRNGLDEVATYDLPAALVPESTSLLWWSVLREPKRYMGNHQTLWTYEGWFFVVENRGI